MRKLVVLWVMSLVVVGAAVAGLTAQSGAFPPRVTPFPDLQQAPAQPRIFPPQVVPPPDQPRVVSGDDFGFRVESIDRNGRPVGRFVARVNGEWREVVEGGRIARVTQ